MVYFTQVELLSGKLHGMLEGIADTAEYFEGNVSLNSEDLGTVPPQWNWPGLKGRLNGKGTVKGPRGRPGIRRLDECLRIRPGPRGGPFGRTGVMVDDLLGNQRVTTGVEGHGLSLRGAPFGDFSLWGSADPEGARGSIPSGRPGGHHRFPSVEADYSDSLTSIRTTDFQGDSGDPVVHDDRSPSLWARDISTCPRCGWLPTRAPCP